MLAADEVNFALEQESQPLAGRGFMEEIVRSPIVDRRAALEDRGQLLWFDTHALGGCGDGI
jgi:hypothetical protein